MGTQPDNCTTPPTRILTEKPSSAFSTYSAASATSASTPRSGGSRLLFGEIDTTSERSDSFASVCSLVQSDSSLFLRFWLTDQCRDTLISHLPVDDLSNLRLVCHDFAVRSAPALFADLNINFKSSTFSKPSRLAALHRLGFYTKKLTFTIPHTSETFLPPLIEPESGEELSFTYTPRIQPPAIREPKYGDPETTEILTRQYPPLFHAATNVHSFVNAFSAFVNLSHLQISCPGYNNSTHYRRSIVDFALISIRIAVERNCLNALDALTLAPIHPGALHYLTPVAGYGSIPSSLRKWSRIHRLTIHAENPAASQDLDHSKLLQAYLHIFKRNLRTFVFRWNVDRGYLPFSYNNLSGAQDPAAKHPAFATPKIQSGSSEETIRPPKVSQRARAQVARCAPFSHLRHLEMENASANAAEIATILALHKHTLEELDIKDVKLIQGTWEEAFAPLTKMAVSSQMAVETEHTADIPIMLSPTAAQQFQGTTEHLKIAPSPRGRAMRASKWLSARRLGHLAPRTPLLPSASAAGATKMVKQGFLDCEAQVKRVFKDKIFAWI